MPSYTVDFVCTHNGTRTDGSIPIEVDPPIPSLAAAQQYMTANVTELVAASSGARITDLTITDVRLS